MERTKRQIEKEIKETKDKLWDLEVELNQITRGFSIRGCPNTKR